MTSLTTKLRQFSESHVVEWRVSSHHVLLEDLIAVSPTMVICSYYIRPPIVNRGAPETGAMDSLHISSRTVC